MKLFSAGRSFGFRLERHIIGRICFIATKTAGVAESNGKIPQKYRFDGIVLCVGIQSAAGHFVIIFAARLRVRLCVCAQE